VCILYSSLTGFFHVQIIIFRKDTLCVSVYVHAWMPTMTLERVCEIKCEDHATDAIIYHHHHHGYHVFITDILRNITCSCL
jgi:hypothetical protein